MTDLMNTAPKPTNTVPGIACMARGGSHFEKAGKVVMSGEGAKVVKERPHWMVIWPFDAVATKLPTAPNPSGVYIMFDGSPYAHLMVYQDPRKENEVRASSRAESDGTLCTAWELMAES